MTTTVRLKGLGKKYGRTHALRDVDLVLEPGVTGLLGPNGAGKTTLLRILATVLAPTTGRLEVLGLDPAEPKQRTGVRRQLGYLPQELGFPTGFTVFAFVDYLAVLKEWTQAGPRHDEVRRVLELVDLADRSGKKVKALSGGQRRRLALAQALIGSPALMLLDEPTTGLDPEQRASLRGVLAEAARTSTVLLSTHQTEDVAALCERVVVLDAGRVCFNGTVRELLQRAEGCVWLADEPHPSAVSTWRTGTGRYRNLADPAPPGAELVEPTLEDAYLLLRNDSPALV
ncbi:MAG TPA: ATP-binding cassette domain-containing protein [Mycobacteriales bacterium]|nr:ATP-binding cassette domain-containing protein [Mycobacteriales bacterium]